MTIAEVAGAIPLPKAPMAPIHTEQLPSGSDWGYQIKWDGIRALARLDGRGGVELFSRNLRLITAKFPHIVQRLQQLQIGACLLDGEITYFNGSKPNFQLSLLRTATSTPSQAWFYVLFDLLYRNGRDLRAMDYQARHEQLVSLFPQQHPQLFVTDLFMDGQALWEWVEAQGWEGVVAKRLSSPYREGKKHTDWYKKRKQIQIIADVVGIKLRVGQIASLVLRYEGRYIGHVSAGLNSELKQVLTTFMKIHPGECPFPTLTPGMRKADVIWLAVPFPCQVSALEFTDSGLLRQPAIVGFGTGS